MKKIIIPVLIMIVAVLFVNTALINKESDSTQYKISKNEHLMMAVLYHQTSAEIRALCYQSFKMAKLSLISDKNNTEITKKRAIIVDIDETILDNSPFEAKCITDNISYPSFWKEWCERADAKIIPGADEFLKFASELGYEIFYVSNRKEVLKEKTIKNLNLYDLPNVDEEHIFLREKSSSKIERRNMIDKSYHIALLIGDNLNDFSGVFEKGSMKDRYEMTDSLKNEFGERFIILPNAMYGEWEGAIYNYDYANHDSVKNIKRLESLNDF